MAAPPRRSGSSPWKGLDSWRIDPMNSGHVRKLAALLHTSERRVHEAIKAAGTRCGDIRKWLEWQPRDKRKS